MRKPLVISLILAAAVPQSQANIEHLMPKVKQINQIEAGSFALGREVSLIDPTDNAALKRALESAGLTPGSNGPEIKVEIVNEIPGAFNHKVADYPDEAYSITVSSDSIIIRAITPTGVTRAAQTIAQLALDTDALSGVQISDWPSFKVRGFMQDVGRSFLPVDELKREIDILSSFKVNTFHWHLTDYTGWRLEIKAYPQLTQRGITRFPGMYYTQEQAKDIQDYAAQRGMIVIPEIDMPGHSHPFELAMGHSMQSTQGIAELKVILEEVCALFDKAPYIHIGGDEKSFADSYIIDMINHVHSLGKKAVIWNQYNAGPAKKVDPAVIPCDMTTNWATAGRLSPGIPNIDMRYNYTNHFDVFADLVGIYKSTIFESQQGTDDIAGTISAAWCDTYTPTPDDIVRQNNFYANVLASSERAWVGGGEQYIETGGVTLPSSGSEFDDFTNWEQRFLYHKNTTMAAASHQIPYVKQTNVRWYITDQIPNGGNADATLAPEQYIDSDATPTSFTINGVEYGVNMATGAGIYLRHIWHPTVKGFYDNPQNNMTAYAWTYVYSPEEQDCGALIEFYTYSRSGNEKAPLAGKWDRRGSRVWLNGNEIAAPQWTQPDATITQDHDSKGLTNENFTARKPVTLHLKKGWNKLFLKLPHANNGGTARDKWQFTFVLTDADGHDALNNIIYSPTRTLDTASESLAALIARIRTLVSSLIGTNVGAYQSSRLDTELLDKANEYEATLDEILPQDIRNAQIEELQQLLDNFNQGYKDVGIVLPAECANYNLVSLRGSRAAYASGSSLVGTSASVSANGAWGFVRRPDGSFNIRNFATRLFISPDATYNTQLKLVNSIPGSGWVIKPASTPGYTIISSDATQMNQTNLNNAVYNWGGGNNINDEGCQYRFILTDYVDEPDPSAINSVPHISDRTVTVRNGYVMLHGCNQEAFIYNMQGRLINSGHSKISCPSGIYLLKIGTQVIKLNVP